MKNLIKLFLFNIVVLNSAIAQQQPVSNEKSLDFSNIKQLKDIGIDEEHLLKFQELSSDFKTLANRMPYAPEKVLLEDELIALFNPDNFDCNCDERIKKKIKSNVYRKKSGQIGAKLGFVPDLVQQRIANTVAFKMENLGSKILASSFQYVYTDMLGKVDTAEATAVDSPVLADFSIDSQFNREASNFFYTIDCSGFLSLALSAGLGVTNENSLKMSADAAFKSKNSLMILSGIINSPIYQAYKGWGHFSGIEEEIINARISLLEHMVNILPNYAKRDDTEIVIATDYQVVVTSNAGSSSFNGEGNINANSNFSFGIASIGTRGESSSKIGRSSGFNDFTCYIVDKNILNKPDVIKYRDIANLISDLKSL